MRTARLSLAACTFLLAASSTPAFAKGEAVTFSQPITVESDATPQDILMQSDNYDDGILTVDGHEYVFDANGHTVLKDQRGILCRWIGIFCPGVDDDAIRFTREEATQRVVDRVIPAIHAEMVRETGRVLPLLAFSRTEAIPAGTAIPHFFGKNPPLNVLSDSWFFFLDLEPHADFGHRVEYVLVDTATGEITRKRAFSPPVLDSEPWLLDEVERFASDVRVYPADLKTLPSPGLWPLKFGSTSVPVPAPSEDSAEGAFLPEARSSIVLFPSLSDLLIADAVAADAAWQPCPEPRRKVAIVINGESRSRSMHFEQSAGAAMSMFRNLGVGNGDMHYMNPATHPTPEEVITEIERIGKTLGPCDKLFFYITGHGTLYDENDDGVPDSPSDSIVYGEGELGKGRYGNSFMEALTKAKAGIVNITVQSCFAGSLPIMIDQYGLRPPEGTTWHVFVSSDATTSSYGNSDEYRASHYTENLTYCVAVKLGERGITNPTIEQIEAITRECHDQLVANPEELMKPDPAQDIGHESITVSSDVEIIEGNSGVKYAEFTITRNPATRALSVRWSTYDPDPEGDPGNYANPQDYQWNKQGESVEFAPGETTKVVRIAITGDLDPEENERFGVWFGSLGVVRHVTIIDDDKSVAAPSSSSAPSTAGRETSTTVILKFPIEVEVNPEVVAVWVIDMAGKKDDSNTMTINPGDWTLTFPGDYGYGKIDDMKGELSVETKCPECEELERQIYLQDFLCEEISLALADAKAALPDLDRRTASAENEAKAAQDRLDAFNNPKSYAESEGRRVTSSDLAAERRFRQQQWQQYRDGDLSASELSDAWGKPMTDAERQQMKDAIRAELEADAAARRSAVEALQAERAKAEADIAATEDLLDSCEEELDALIAELEECEKTCKETDTAMMGGEDGGATSSSVSSVSVDVASASAMSEESDDDEDDGEESEESSASEASEESDDGEGDIGWFCAWFGIFCPDDILIGGDGEEVSSASSSEEQCEEGTTTKSACADSCSGECRETYESFSGLKCFKCILSDAPLFTCNPPTQTEAECKADCFVPCTKIYTRSDRVGCFDCVSEKKSSSSQPGTANPSSATTVVPSSTRPVSSVSSSKSSTASKASSAAAATCKLPAMDLATCEDACEDSEEGECVKESGTGCYTCRETSTAPQCPSGTTDNRGICEDSCAAQGGTCTSDNQGCYSCTVLNCPSGTYKNECPSSCSGGCDTAAQQGGVTCYKCKASCTEVCAAEDLQVGTNWTSYIESQISGYSCVSGASYQLQTTTIGSCTCSQQPTVTIDQTKPVCKGSVCGDVVCGGSTSCTQGDTQYTVSCNWGGWKNIGENKFQPVIGQ